MSHGIPARRHPEYKVLAKAAGDLALAREARTQRMFDYLTSEPVVDRTRGMDVRSEEYREASKAVMAEATEHVGPYPFLSPEMDALRKQAEASNLYRWDGGSLSIRYDKAGKAAWRAEFERLGKPLPVELTLTPYRRPW